MKKILYQSLLLLLLVLILSGGAGWFYADRLLSEVVRPQLIKRAAALLQAEVQLEALSWTGQGLELRELSISATDKFLIRIPRLRIDLTLSSLWQRQLEAVRISSPRIETFPAQATQDQASSPFKLPQSLPLSIRQLTVTNGQLHLFGAGQRFSFQQLDFSGALLERSAFQLSGFFGEDKSQPFTINGSAEIAPQPLLTIESLSWQHQALLSSPLVLQLAETELSLGRSALQLQQFDEQKLRGLLSAFGQTDALPAPLTFSLAGISVNFSLLQQALQLELQIDSGKFGWDGIDASVSAVEIQLQQLPDSWSLSAQLRGPADTALELSGRLDNSQQLAGQAKLQIPNPGQLKTALLSGAELPIAGALRLSTEFSLQSDQLEVTTLIQGSPSAAPQGEYLFNVAQLSGRGQLMQAQGKQQFSLDLKCAEQPFLAVNGDFEQLKVALTVTDLRSVRSLLAPQRLPEQLKELSRLAAKGQLTRKGAEWQGDFTLAAEQLMLSELSLKQLTGHSKLLFSAEKLAFSEGTFDVALQHGKELNAQLHAEAAASYRAQQFTLQLQQFELSRVNYISADEQTGVGDAALKIQGSVSGPFPSGPFTLNLSGTAAAAEVLAGQFYADLSPYRANFSAAGSFSPEQEQLQLETFKLQLPKLATLSANGQLSRQQINLQTAIEAGDLSESFGEQIRPILSGSYPALSELYLQGKLALTSRLLWTPDGWQSSGSLKPQGVNAYWQRQQLEMSAGSGSIPFAISSGRIPAEIESAPEQTGTLSFDALSVGLAALEEGQLQLAAANNRFSVRSPLLLQLAGGRVAVENLNFDWSEGEPQGSVKINVNNVELENLTRQLGLPVMQGQLRADLGTIRYRNRQLSSDGLINLEVFAGRFQLRNLRYSEPLSRYPRFFADVDFSGLDLLQATRTFDFGEMNGILDGQIHGLKLFGKTPAAFTAVIGTRLEGKRNISVKALNNLSILSQGGISAALSRGVYRFIDFYRYRQIGFKCSLENDTFTLLGTALPGSQRYLVDGGLLPPRIDITTTSPTISFKEMLKRLGRLDRTGN